MCKCINCEWAIYDKMDDCWICTHLECSHCGRPIPLKIECKYWEKEES